jgi:hypothetical protein
MSRSSTTVCDCSTPALDNARDAITGALFEKDPPPSVKSPKPIFQTVRRKFVHTLLLRAPETIRTSDLRFRKPPRTATNPAQIGWSQSQSGALQAGTFPILSQVGRGRQKSSPQGIQLRGPLPIEGMPRPPRATTPRGSPRPGPKLSTSPPGSRLRERLNFSTNPRSRSGRSLSV